MRCLYASDVHINLHCARCNTDRKCLSIEKHNQQRYQLLSQLSNVQILKMVSTSQSQHAYLFFIELRTVTVYLFVVCFFFYFFSAVSRFFHFISFLYLSFTYTNPMRIMCVFISVGVGSVLYPFIFVSFVKSYFLLCSVHI